jgi:hypothetical protein
VCQPTIITFFQISNVKFHFSHTYLYFIAFDMENYCFMIFVCEIM